MKRKISIALLLILVVSFVLIAFVGCGEEIPSDSTSAVNTENNDPDNDQNATPDGKQVPVYQGMTISSAEKQTASLTWDAYFAPGEDKPLLPHEKPKPGEAEGDLDGRNDQVDEENPYPENGENETIEDEIESSFDVVGSPDTIYYATANENIYINIHINNPDSFEILSFTLNDKKYSSYMFEDGSDMETIVLKYNVGDVSGIVEYTIDAIKYIDGTEIKDVLIDGNKTVMAGVQTENQVTAKVENLDIDTNAIAFSVNINDRDDLIAFSKGVLKAVVYDGEEIVAEKDLVLGENAVSFENLKTNTLYQYAVVGYYDNLSGSGFGLNILYTDAFYTDSVLLFDNVTIGKDEMSFGFVWHEDRVNKALISLKLYTNETLVKTLDTTATSVTELLSNTTYTIVAEYENLGKTESISIVFTTLEKVIPNYWIIDPIKTKTSIGFSVDEEDIDSVGAITKIELVHASGTVMANSVEARKFEGLLSNNAYTVKVTYVYNLNDGNGDVTLTKETTITTDAKAEPTVSIANTDVSKTDFSGDITLTDTDDVLVSKAIRLYQGDEKIRDDEWVSQLNFNALSYYTDYKIVAEYSFDLNDGNGVQTKTYEHMFKTAPHIDITAMQAVNTSALFEGDYAMLQATIDNPLKAKVTGFVINGKTVSASVAGTMAVAELQMDKTLGSGKIDLVVEAVLLMLDGKEYTVASDKKASAEVFVNGKFEFVGWDFVNAAGETLYALVPGEVTYFRLTFNNPTDYTIDSVVTYGEKVIKGSDLIKLDQNTYLYPVQYILVNDYDANTRDDCMVIWYGNETVNSMRVLSISYHNEHVSKTFACSEYGHQDVLVLNSNEIRKISSVEDLYHLNDGIRYELTCDIDLAGMEWKGVPFWGILDGKGYAIKNMSFAGNINHNSGGVRLGLFSSAYGLIENLKIEKATILVSTQTKEVCCGAIVADATGPLMLKNCSVDDKSSVVITTTCYGYVGGLVGVLRTNGAFENCVNAAVVSVNAVDSMTCTGGIVGYLHCGIVTMTGCTNSGSVNAYKAGGMVGEKYLGSLIITDCANSGALTGSYLGGMVGWSGDGSLEITNAIHTGTLDATGYAGGMVGYLWLCSSKFTNCVSSDAAYGNLVGFYKGGYSMNNSYSLLPGDYEHASYNPILCTTEQLATKEFYTETLGWDEADWDFSDLDPANGKYPTLK